MVRTLSPERREKYLQSALELFVKNGVTNTSTAEIARDAGTAAGTLFLYFPTKQVLMDELVLKIGREQAGTINRLLEPAQSAREAFFTIWDGSVRWFLTHMDAYLYVQQVRDTGMISAHVVAESAQFFAFYYQAVQKGWAEGSIQQFPIDLIGGFLYQDIVAVMNLARAEADPARRDGLIQMGFQIFWDGIKESK